MIFRSPYPDMPVPEQSLTEYVLQRAGELSDHTALIDGPSGRSMTFGQLAGAIRKVAAGLEQRGFKKGDVFAIYSPNLPEYTVIFHAVASVGGINTTVNPLYTAEELTYQLKDANAKYLLTIGMFKEAALQSAREAGIKEVFTFDGAEGTTPFTDLMAEGEPPRVDIDPANDLVALPYSSGTTGMPKGVMLTHRNLVANMCQVDAYPEMMTLDHTDTVIGVLPFYHIYGMTLILNFTLMRGAKVVTMPRFDMQQFLELMQQHRVTFAYLVPPIILGLAKQPVVDQYDLSALRGINSGAAPLDEQLANEASKRLGCPVTQGYGLTETSPVTHIGPNTSPERMRPGSVGPAIPATECKIVDTTDGRELGRNEEGELWIRGPQVMKGYLNRPEATAESIDDEGWFHTGDISYVDDEDFFHVVDRVKELIKYKGNQVPPAQLEALLIGHPAVSDAAVIPSPDTEAGEIPKAFVVRSGEVTDEELMDYVAGHVAPYKKIRRLEFVEEIPKSASGKILRRVLRDREREEVGAAR